MLERSRKTGADRLLPAGTTWSRHHGCRPRSTTSHRHPWLPLQGAGTAKPWGASPGVPVPAAHSCLQSCCSVNSSP